jgi:hypothetical protein
MRHTRLIATTVLLTAAYSAAAAADEGAFYGLLRERDLSPFGFIRLDMRPAHAVTLEPGDWAIETELGYQNTWALSPEVEQYLKGLEPSGRRNIGPAEVQAIEQLPGENYLLDLETALLDLTLHYKVSEGLSVYAIASAISYQGGFLDSTIEQFHQAFGFSTFGRPAVARNQATLIYDLKGAHVVFLESPTDGGFTDPTIGFRYTGLQFSPTWRLSLEGAAKIPLGGRRLLLSTGRTDYGIQASLQRRGHRQAFYIDAAAVYYAGTREPARQHAQVIPTLVLGYERMLTARTNVNVQGYISKSVYSHDQTDLDELLGTKYQYSIGLRHRRENWLVSFAFTENLQNINNTPDIGFQLGVAWFPDRRAR